MGTLADSLFTVLMGWVRALVSALWSLFSSDDMTVLGFLGKNWMMIAVVMIAAGLVIDWIIWLLRWQPYHLWAQRARRLLRMEEPEKEAEEPAKAHAAVMPRPKTREQLDRTMEIEAHEIALPVIEQDEEEDVLERAQAAPDEYAYPGMRYDSAVQEEMGSTQRYGTLTQEGPGAAEVERRRAEIEAWQLQMQEEARAEAERAQREAEQARLAQEAYEAEQARLAQEPYEAEQARLAQEEYERQLAQYERQKAQYALELAEYERQKALYDAELARQAALQETAQELQPAAKQESETAHTSRRRRGAQKRYSDYIAGDAVDELPDAPQWPQLHDEAAAPAQEKPARSHKLLDRMAKIIEPEEENLVSMKKLPPRVNVQDAYKPAAAPRKPGRRSRG